MMHDENECRDTSFAFQPLEALPAPSSADAEGVTHLDLTECEVKDVTNLGAYRNLSTLIIDKNNLTGLEIFPVIESLQTLWCNNNEIEDLVQFMDEVSKKFKNIKYLSMMRNPACPSLMSIEEPDLEANRLFRLYVLYRLPQLQIIDCEAVTDKERMEASIRGQFAVKLKRVSKQQVEQQQQENGDAMSRNDVHSKIWKDGDGDKNYIGFQARIVKKKQDVRAPSKPSEGNRFIGNQQL